MRRKALVIVLGELARSPRMQYQSISLAESNFQVEVIASGRTADKPFEEVHTNPFIRQRHMPTCPNKLLQYLPGVLSYLVKTLFQTVLLIFYLFTATRPQLILAQNPPSIPTLPVICIYTKLVGSRLIIDWHNYGYSILSLKLGPNHPLVRLYKSAEMYFGNKSDSGFVVSKRMAQDLIESHGIKRPLFTLYDRPPEHFKLMDLDQKHEFFMQIGHEIEQFRSSEDIRENYANLPNGTEFSRFTYKTPSGQVGELKDRPRILISSTSWTEDEDFSVLLKALQLYCANDLGGERPHLLCIITGKGPLKEHYRKELNKLELVGIEVVLPWLKAKDYPKMLACADVGVCLHQSSSGYDLPMKVVDMLGCGIPVLAHHYPTIKELVSDDFGLIFKNYWELESGLERVLMNDSDNIGRRKNIKEKFLSLRWKDHWNKEAKPVIESLISASRS